MANARRSRAFKRGLATGLIALLAAAAFAVSALAAGGGYGPPPPIPPNIPGGFTAIVAAKTIPTAGGAFTVNVAIGTTGVSVPANTFTKPAYIILTKGTVSGVNKHLPSTLKGGTAVFAMGIFAGNNGKALHASKAVTLTIKGSRIKGRDKVVVYSTSRKRFVSISATVTSGKAVVHVQPATELAIVAPKA